ncbi:MAG TPA: GNAT family N-acetyltransferase [Mucilaginibacter sp.]|jgi:ribosomal-protein-alanine N-acetyltransferase
MNIIVQTPRLIVREFIPEEETLLVDLYKDERVTQYVNKRSEEETRKQFAEALTQYENETGLGRWGVFNPADNDFIGICILKPADSDPSRIELGYVLTPKYWGQGLATELSKALIFYGFADKALTEIYACTYPKNTASQNVLLKAGFAKHGNIFWHGADLMFFRLKNGQPPLYLPR